MGLGGMDHLVVELQKYTNSLKLNKFPFAIKFRNTAAV
jgi:hypothetical protein